MYMDAAAANPVRLVTAALVGLVILLVLIIKFIYGIHVFISKFFLNTPFHNRNNIDFFINCVFFIR